MFPLVFLASQVLVDGEPNHQASSSKFYASTASHSFLVARHLPEHRSRPTLVEPSTIYVLHHSLTSVQFIDFTVSGLDTMMQSCGSCHCMRAVPGIDTSLVNFSMLTALPFTPEHGSGSKVRAAFMLLGERSPSE